MNGLLQVYAQAFWHADAYLVGQPEALAALQDAITAALEAHAPRAMKAFVSDFVSDGEGYGLWVIPTDEETMCMMGLPYTDEVARGDEEGAMWPADLLPPVLPRE